MGSQRVGHYLATEQGQQRSKRDFFLPAALYFLHKMPACLRWGKSQRGKGKVRGKIFISNSKIILFQTNCGIRFTLHISILPLENMLFSLAAQSELYYSSLIPNTSKLISFHEILDS